MLIKDLGQEALDKLIEASASIQAAKQKFVEEILPKILEKTKDIAEKGEAGANKGAVFTFFHHHCLDILRNETANKSCRPPLESARPEALFNYFWSSNVSASEFMIIYLEQIIF